MNTQHHFFNDPRSAPHPIALQDINDILSSITIPVRKGSSRHIRDAILTGLELKGWSSKIKVASSTNITITSAKASVGLCVQLGNVARLYADLLKLQTMHASQKITYGAIILPSESASRQLGSNIANAARLRRELPVFSRIVTLPLCIFEFESGGQNDR